MNNVTKQCYDRLVHLVSNQAIFNGAPTYIDDANDAREDRNCAIEAMMLTVEMDATVNAQAEAIVRSLPCMHVDKLDAILGRTTVEELFSEDGWVDDVCDYMHYNRKEFDAVHLCVGDHLMRWRAANGV